MDYLRIGLISKPHGIQGAIKVMPLTDNVERFNDLYDAFVETVTEALKKGDTVALMGFGTFELKKKAARTGINPLTKEKIKIKASKTPALKFSSAYKAEFNTKK